MSLVRWGHELHGADPWGGWTFVERGALPEGCGVCHWIDPALADEHVPTEEHLARIVDDVERDDLISGFDRRLVFSGRFSEVLLDSGVPESAIRPLPISLFTFDGSVVPAVRCISCQDSDRCTTCGRVRMVRRAGPTSASIEIENPGPAAIVRSVESFGRGYERGWSIYLSDAVYERLRLPRHAWDVFVS